jgi:predicted RNA methylase
MDVFSNLMVIGECLLDGPRTRAFERAIAKVVRPGHTVLDVGTGSGILALFSARAGARRVLAVDIAADIAKFARNNAAGNGFAATIDVRECDVKSLPAHGGIDVLTMELMDTWLVAEQQAAALNALHANGTIGAATTLVPYRYQCLIELVEYDFSFYGFRMPFVIQARNFAVQKHVSRRLSQVRVANDISFREPLAPDVRRRVSIPVEDDGTCNAAVLTARTFLAPGIAIGSTSDMNMPVIVPLPPHRLRRGTEASLEVSYSMGAGFGSFDLRWQESVTSHVAQPPRAVARLDAGHVAHPGI